ncbi:LacI family DNA-binding transcriptional regulator [Citreimonas sp.]|uniref:LacI family DNA-binding transcriptional regulator n=1 Tax=Citreimonas sp. TaxID=3036715 RepID=UPI0035C80CF3
MNNRGAPTSRNQARRTTLADVAERVGTSTITVSRALSRPEMVSEALRTRIVTTARELGYVPNPAARALVSQRSNVIGILIPSVTNSVFSDVLSGLYDAVGDAPFNVQLGNTRYNPETEEELLRVFLSQRPAGLVVAGIDQSPESRRMLETAQCPVVQIMEMDDDPVHMLVGFSHHDAAQAATEHLFAQGYRAPGFIGARMDPRSKRRLEGFQSALSKAGQSPAGRAVTTGSPSTFRLGGELLNRLLEQAPDTDAVFCNNDDLALGVQFEALRRGIRIGIDFGICGFNDLEVMSAAHPSLTSVRTFRREMGRMALEKLLAHIDQADTGPDIVDLGYRLVPRASTSRTES